MERMLPSELIGRKGADITVKLAAGILERVSDDPAHPLRQRFDAFTRDFIERLQAGPAVHREGRGHQALPDRRRNPERLPRRAVERPEGLAEGRPAKEDSSLRRRLVATGGWVGTMLAEDPQLRASLNENLELAARGAAPEFAGFLTSHIADTVKNWDSARDVAPGRTQHRQGLAVHPHQRHHRRRLDRGAAVPVVGRASPVRLIRRRMRRAAIDIGAIMDQHMGRNRPRAGTWREGAPEDALLPGRDLFEVARYLAPMEARLAQGCLEASGIPAVLADDHLVQANMLLAAGPRRRAHPGAAGAPAAGRGGAGGAGARRVRAGRGCGRGAGRIEGCIGAVLLAYWTALPTTNPRPQVTNVRRLTAAIALLAASCSPWPTPRQPRTAPSTPCKRSPTPPVRRASKSRCAPCWSA